MKKLTLTVALIYLIMAGSLYSQEISFKFKLTPQEETEKTEWLVKGLMYPKYGYDKVSWGDDLGTVKKHYGNLTNTSDEDSLFGLKKFTQAVKMGGMVKRDFYFYHGNLIKVEVQYDKSVDPDLITDKIESTYGEITSTDGNITYIKFHAVAGQFDPSIISSHEWKKKGRFISQDERRDPYYKKNSYPLAVYRHDGVDTDNTMDKLRREFKEKQGATEKQKQKDALGL